MWGPGKKVDGVFPGHLRAFGIYADQSTTAALDEGEWHRAVEQEAEHFMAKWIAAAIARAGLRHAVECPNVTGAYPNVTGKTRERIAQSKRGRAGSLAVVD